MLMAYYTKMCFSSSSIIKPLKYSIITNPSLPLNPSTMQYDNKSNKYQYQKYGLNNKSKYISTIKASSKQYLSAMKLLQYPMIHKNKPIKVKYHQITKNKSIMFYSLIILSSFTGIIYLYTRKGITPKSLLDFNMKRFITKVLMQNKTATTIISHMLYSKCALPSTQLAFNSYIKNKILTNTEFKTKLQALLRNKVLLYLQSGKSITDIQTLLKSSFIFNKDDRSMLFDYINAKLLTNHRDYIIKLLEQQCKDLFTNEQLKQYITTEFAREIHSALRDPNTINTTIQHINS